MKIKDFVEKIHSVIYKRDLLDALTNAQKEIKEISLPMYEKADGLFLNKNFQSPQIRRLIPTFDRLVKKRQGNIVTTVKFALANCLKMIEQVAPVVERNFKETTPSSVMTYRKAQYIQFVDALSYYSEYTRLFLSYLITAETAQFDAGNTIAKRMTPAQIARVEAGLNNFCLLTNVFNKNVRDVMALLEKVPDVIIIPENIDMVTETAGPSATDPLDMKYITANTSPFYAIVARMALKYHDRYEKAKEERELITYQLINLEQTMNNSPDPQVQRQIDFYRERVQKLDAQIAEQERLYG